MKSKSSYVEQLKQAAAIYLSIISFGLDPVIKALHSRFHKHEIMGFYYMLEELFHHMKEQKVYPGAFKLNHGFYAKHCIGRGSEMNFDGLVTLGKIMDLIEQLFPGMPKILDFKRGDIGKSSDNYAEEGFKVFGADAVTVAPYMGGDSIIPFTKYCGFQPMLAENRGVYILNLTSNPGSNDFEMLELVDGNKVYMKVSDWICNHAGQYPGLGAVVGAPDLSGLRSIVKKYKDMVDEIPLLIPGVGGQGGKADEVVTVLNYVGYNKSLSRINLSSGLTHPWGEKEPAPEDWKKVITETLFNYNKLTGMA